MINPLGNNSGADNIFDRMDANHDNSVSKEEALKFGITTLGSEDLTREQFKSKFSVFMEKTSTQQGMLEDFGNIFYDDNGEKIVRNVELTDAQRQELLSRMEMFEAYNSTLTDDEKENLAKNKSIILGLFNFKDNEPVPDDYRLPDYWSDEKKAEFKNLTGVEWTYNLKDVAENRFGLRDYKHSQYYDFLNNDFKKIKENLQTGKPLNITNEELSKLLNLTKINDEVSDGQIGTFCQGDLGNCWFLSQLNNYAQTEEGRKNISERIKNNGNGTYTVTFNNPFDQTKKEDYIVTEDELSKYDATSWDSIFENIWSIGDKDVRILEMAANKMLESNIGKKYPDEDLIINSGDLIKNTMVHRALGYTEPCMMFFMNDNTLKVKQMIMKGEKNATILDADVGEFPISYVFNFNNFNEKNITCSTIGSQDSEKVTDLMKQYDNKLDFEHVYNIEQLSEGKIIVNDPHDTAFPHVITKENFDKLFDTIFYYPINNHIPLSECSD